MTDIAAALIGDRDDRDRDHRHPPRREDPRGPGLRGGGRRARTTAASTSRSRPILPELRSGDPLGEPFESASTAPATELLDLAGARPSCCERHGLMRRRRAASTSNEDPDRARHAAGDHPAQPRDRAPRRRLRPRPGAHRPELRSARSATSSSRSLGVRAPDHHLGVSGEAFARAGRRRSSPAVERAAPRGAPRPPARPRRHRQRRLRPIVAKRLGIPVFHMEAGNRCFDDRVPEEVNRRIIDHSSDVLMPYTERSRANLLREGSSRSGSSSPATRSRR